MSLEKETFEAAEELSGIHLAIADAQSTLAQLNETKELYLTEREQEAVNRIAKALEESREALQEINTNHQELKAYGNELRALAHILKGFLANLVSLSQAFRERMAIADADLEVRRTEIQDVFEQIRTQRELIQEDMATVATDRQKLADEAYLLKDQREAFERAWGELEIKRSN